MPSGGGKSSSKSSSKAPSVHAFQKLKLETYDLGKKNKLLKEENKKLSDTVDRLSLDKAELQSKLEAEQKRNGGSISSETEQLKLVEGMHGSLRNLVQQKFFVRWPFLDRTMFSKGNLITPAAAYLRIAESDIQRYAVDIRRVCIAKTTYWRGYCADQVKREYISKCRIACDCLQNVFGTTKSASDHWLVVCNCRKSPGNGYAF